MLHKQLLRETLKGIKQYKEGEAMKQLDALNMAIEALVWQHETQDPEQARETELALAILDDLSVEFYQKEKEVQR